MVPVRKKNDSPEEILRVAAVQCAKLVAIDAESLLDGIRDWTAFLLHLRGCSYSEVQRRLASRKKREFDSLDLCEVEARVKQLRARIRKHLQEFLFVDESGMLLDCESSIKQLKSEFSRLNYEYLQRHPGGTNGLQGRAAKDLSWLYSVADFKANNARSTANTRSRWQSTKLRMERDPEYKRRYMQQRREASLRYARKKGQDARV